MKARDESQPDPYAWADPMGAIMALNGSFMTLPVRR